MTAAITGDAVTIALLFAIWTIGVMVFGIALGLRLGDR